MEISVYQNEEIDFYRVKSGEDLASISKLFNVDINCIIRNNPKIDFYEGEVVKIVKRSGLFHIVKPGETLENIANKYGEDIDNLIKINLLKNKRLFIGQKIKIK